MWPARLYGGLPEHTVGCMNIPCEGPNRFRGEQISKNLGEMSYCVTPWEMPSRELTWKYVCSCLMAHIKDSSFLHEMTPKFPRLTITFSAKTYFVNFCRRCICAHHPNCARADTILMRTYLKHMPEVRYRSV